MPNLTSLGEAASVDELYVKLIAPLLPEIKTNVQAPVNFKSLNGLTVTELDSSGNIDTLGKLSLHSGTNLSSVYSNVNRYSIELDSNFDFVIYDNINDQPRITIDATTGQTTFNPPITGTSLSKVNVDLNVNSFYPLFAATSTSGTISTVDVASNIIYTPTTTTLSLGNLASDTISDNTSSFGTSGQVLSSTGSGLLWTTTPTINNGTLSINTGSHLSGSGTFTANQSGNTNVSITTDATNLNTASTIVSRDINGNFTCGNITGDLTGISTSANTIYVLQNSTNTDFQVPVLAATHTANGYYNLKVDPSTSNFTYNTSTHTLKPVNINISGTLADSSGSVGSSTNLLSSTATGTSWVSAPVINNGTLTLASNNHISGSGTFTANQAGGTSVTFTSDATNLNTASTIVARDSSGGFTCGTIIGNLTGTSSIASTTTLAPVASGTIYLTGTSGYSSGNYPLQTDSLGQISFNTGSNILSLNNGGALSVYDATNTTHYFNIYSIGNILNVSYYNGTTTTIPFTFTGTGVFQTAYIKDSVSNNGAVGQYLTRGASGILWATLPTYPTVNDGILTITNGTHITGSGTFTANQAGNTSITIATDATNLNTVSTIVARDSSGGFSAGTITANLTGVASTAQTFNVTAASGASNYDIIMSNTPGLLNNQPAYNSGIYYTPSTTTLHSAIFAGNLTGSASLIDTTLQTSGTQYLTFVPLSASAPSGQVLGTDTTLSYDVQFSILTCSTFAGNLTGTATNANNTQTYLTSTNFSYNIPFMLYDTATTQPTYLDTGGNITYNPSTQTLNANYITSRQLPILWNNDFLIAGYTATYPSNATLNTYYLLSQLPATGDNGNGVTQLFSGVIGGWGGDANCQITFKSRGGMVASGTIISDIITTAALIGIVDLIVYTNGGLFQVYLVVKPNVYYTFNFTMTGLNRDVNNILYQPSVGTTTTPTGTISIASVITTITFTNTGGALSAVSLNTTGGISATTTIAATGVVSGSSFNGAGTGLTGTASSLTAGKVTIANDTTTTSMSLLLSNNTTTGTVNYNNYAGLFNASTLVTTIPYINNTNSVLSNGFGPATSVTISNCFNGIYNFYDITFMVISATAGTILKFNAGPSASSLWNNTYSYSYNTTTPVIVNVNNTSQASVELGSMINGYCMFKLTYVSMGYGTVHPMVMWDGFIQNSGGNGWSKGQASYQATSVSFTNAIFTTTANMSGYYSVRGYN